MRFPVYYNGTGTGCAFLLMMIVAPNSLVRQEGAQGEEKEEAGGRRRLGSIGTPTPGTKAPTGPTQSGVSDARNRRRHGW